ncbi:MAG: PIG-L family deacetylase [Alphaproteobacteria bacterium]|nr:PIG-L family deacetylase [Alphaproteobacteria bacterium]
MYGDRVLILAPHPDDEVVGCAYAAMRAVAAGCAVAVLDLTTGVPDATAAWPWRRGRQVERVARRLREAADARAQLGLVAIGAPALPTRQVWRNLGAAAQAMSAAIARFRPSVLWAPAYEGGHIDHDAACFLAGHVAAGSPAPAVWEYAAYNFDGGRIRSHAFPSALGSEVTLAPTDEERLRKAKALAAYASERGNLDYVRLDREQFRPLAAYDFARPPHGGTTFYARFHWVPFRHPRIDRTTPAQLSAALMSWPGPGGRDQ